MYRQKKTLRDDENKTRINVLWVKDQIWLAIISHLFVTVTRLTYMFPLLFITHNETPTWLCLSWEQILTENKPHKLIWKIIWNILWIIHPSDDFPWWRPLFQLAQGLGSFFSMLRINTYLAIAEQFQVLAALDVVWMQLLKISTKQYLWRKALLSVVSRLKDLGSLVIII